ncbi:MAG: nitroreductase family protein [Candidatus Heimdallarchaeota archaeon]|nr:nitroreductase family protein [Candidatus Heimdallarchaeota archaeon]MBY8992970.1 nitroreductase family protein [Candidatus Heimdallarchaeota archaeon]
MLLIQGIDYVKCSECGICVVACTAQLFSETDDKDKKIIFMNPHEVCVKCGHCISVCPEEAILFEDDDPAFNFEGTKKLPDIVSYEDLMKILRMRRSIRVYKDKPVLEKKLEKVLQAMRYAPTASNRQNWRLTVVTNKKEIEYLSKESTKDLKLAKKLLPLRYLALPFLSPGLRKRAKDPRTEVILDRELGAEEKGQDIVFFNAPCVIILYSRPYTSNMAPNDAGVVITHGMLAAQALGLGTCWIGIAQRVFQKRKIRKHFKVPKGYLVYGVITLGIPDIEYQRAPPRRAVRVQRMK